MPLYETRCEECTHLDTVIKTVGDRNQPNECSRCGGISNRIFSTCASLKEFTPYSSKGRAVSTRGQEARADKRGGRVNVRDLSWFKNFKKEHKAQEGRPSGKRVYTTLAKGA